MSCFILLSTSPFIWSFLIFLCWLFLFPSFINYAQYEEAEWVGLTPGEAVQKQRAIEAKANPDIPLQDVYTQELLTKLRGNYYSQSYLLLS